uniref:Uncharacterized protein n=1 Tax=Rhabditophanes sp. KR3021 TaxID=114890 RepID=A0AC35U7U4_9BILA
MRGINFFLFALIFGIVIFEATACNIIIHVKSMTTKKFQAQVISPAGLKSKKWAFTKQKERNTFQEKSDVCGIGEFAINVFENETITNTAKVTLNGIGRVDYEVGDDLKPVMVVRHGAACDGQCAPLST